MISSSLMLWALQGLGLTLGGSVILFCVYQALDLLYTELTSSIRDLPGPPSDSIFFGNFKEMFNSDSTALHQKWTEKYGKTIKYKGVMGITSLHTTDLKAVNHFLVNNQTYHKPPAAVYSFTRVLGEGSLLAVEGDVHKLQRKIFNPAFGPQQIRDLTEIFVEKALELRDRWTEEISKQTGNDSEGLPARIDALSWLSRATLDVIGLAGFNYKFDSLSDSAEKNELSEAFAVMLRKNTSLNPIVALRELFPALRFIPAPGDTDSKVASKKMFDIGAQLLADSKASNEAQNGKSHHARDILSILVRANSASDLSEGQRLSDKDVLAQIPTFMLAGHETTSVAITWALYSLTQERDVQDKLRAELSTISTDNPTMDDLNSLPYLDAVVRETLRLHAPIPPSMRAAVKDDVVPLSEPYVDSHGKKHDTIHIKKGQVIMIPILPINMAKDLWGEDAWEFNPDRWQNLPEAVSAVPTIWGNMMTFLGGPKACIGYRFTIVEMKAIIFTLVRAFDLDLAVPAKDIVKKSSIVNRPVLVTASGKNENQMPLLVRIVNRD